MYVIVYMIFVIFTCKTPHVSENRQIWGKISNQIGFFVAFGIRLHKSIVKKI